MIGSLIGKMADAQKMSIAQIQQSIASGSLPSYIGIPLLQEKAQQAQKLQMAQAILKEQGTPDVTVKDQVMQAADQVTRPEPPVMPSTPDGYRQQPAPSQGVESLASNMPEEYAGGGIIAFADRGVVPGAEDVHIPGKRDDEDAKAAGYRAYSGGRGLPIQEPEAPSYSRGRGAMVAPSVDTFDPSMVNTSGSELDSLLSRPSSREFSPLTTPATPTMRSDEAANAEAARYLNTIAPPERGIDSAPAARPPAGRDGIRLTPGVELPQAPKMPEFPSFEGLEKSYGDYVSDSRSRRQKLEDLILGQQADRPEREKKNVGTALMEAGFGMMAGESPFAGVNIGRGAMAGAKSYAQGIDQLQKDDARIVSQLASLGLRGEELEQEAMKQGINIQKMKAEMPQLQAQTAETMARIPGLQIDPYVKRATIGQIGAQTEHLGAETERTRMATELMPIETAYKGVAAAGRYGTQNRPGSIPAKELSALETSYQTILDDPLAYSPIAVEIESQFPELVRGLSQDKDSIEFKKARAAITPFVKQYIAAKKRDMYENAPTRRGSDYGYPQSED